MLVVNDALDAVFLGCFLFGLVFTAASLLLGGLDVGGGTDAPGGAEADGDGFLGPLSVSSVLAFLSWFGGVGYLARNAVNWAALLAVLVGIAGGVAGAYLIAQFLARVVRPNDRPLDPEDYRLPGVIARVTSSIRAGGIGEIVYEQAGARQVAAARAADARAIGRGTEVVVLRTERGIALVAPWDALMAGTTDERSGAERGRNPDRIVPT